MQAALIDVGIGARARCRRNLGESCAAGGSRLLRSHSSGYRFGPPPFVVGCGSAARDTFIPTTLADGGVAQGWYANNLAQRRRSVVPARMAKVMCGDGESRLRLFTRSSSFSSFFDNQFNAARLRLGSLGPASRPLPLKGGRAESSHPAAPAASPSGSAPRVASPLDPATLLEELRRERGDGGQR